MTNLFFYLKIQLQSLRRLRRWPILGLALILLGSDALGQEAPRAPVEESQSSAESVQSINTGKNLIRNGSFEGSLKYSTQSGEWKAEIAQPYLDSTSAVVGRYSLCKPIKPVFRHGRTIQDNGIEIAPFRCKRDRLYCVSFYAKSDEVGGIIHSVVRGMHHSDHPKADTHIRFKANMDKEWRRYTYFFPADRFPKKGNIANSYYLVFKADQCSKFWIDGIQVEEVVREKTDHEKLDHQIKHVEGYPSPYSLFSPVEVCLESKDLPIDHLYSPTQQTAIVRAAIVNDSSERKVREHWEVLDHKDRMLWQSDPIDRVLLAKQTIVLDQEISLPQKGLMKVRYWITDEEDHILSSSVEPIAVLPYDLSEVSHAFAERFGVNLGFVSETVPLEHNKALHMLRRLGFRWVRNTAASWRKVQSKNENEFDWSRADRETNFAYEQELRQFVTIHDYPAWAGKGRFPNDLPFDMDWAYDDPRWENLEIETAFDIYLKALVQRYKGKVDAYQLGNESSHYRADPQLVYRLCQRTAGIIRSIDPDAKIIGASIIWTKVGFWEQVMALGGLDDMDYFGWDYDCYVNQGTTYKQMLGMQAQMKQHGGKILPSFNYETGWGSGWLQDYSADPLGLEEVDHSQIPDEMMKCFARIFSAGCEHFVLHHTAYPENLMGSYWNMARWPTQLYDERERPRISLVPYNVAIQYLGLSAPFGPISDSDSLGIESYAFQDLRQDRPVIVLWNTTDTPQSVETCSSAGPIMVVDMMGNESLLQSKKKANQAISLPIDGEVLLLVGESGVEVEDFVDCFKL